MPIKESYNAASSEKELHQTVLKQIQEPIGHDFSAVRLKLRREAANKNPILFKFLSKFDKAGDLTIKISEQIHNLHISHSKDSLAQGFHIGSIVVAAVNFFTIPLIYLVAYLTNQKVPFNLKNNAKWGYAAVVLGLVIAAFAAPAVAIYIGFTAAGLALAVSIFMLGKTLYQRHQLRREKRKAVRELQLAESELVVIQHTASELEQQLNAVSSEGEIITIYQDIAILKERYDVQKKMVADLKNRKFECEQNIKNNPIIKVVDRSVGISFVAAGLLGLALFVFFPPLGTAILIGVAVAAATYFVGRIIMNVTQFFMGVLGAQNKIEKANNERTEDDGDDPDMILTASIAEGEELPLEDEDIEESTLSVLKDLGMAKEDAGKFLSLEFPEDTNDKDEMADTVVTIKPVLPEEDDADGDTDADTDREEPIQAEHP